MFHGFSEFQFSDYLYPSRLVCGKGRFWKDAKGNVRSIDTILAQHKRWMESNPERWARDDVGLRDADLRGADLIGAHLRNAELSDADFRGANLGGADLSYANLQKADLSGAFLYQAHLTRADLAYAHLSRASLRDADLADAGLSGADLSGAGLNGTLLNRASLTEANLTGAGLSGADLSGAVLDRTDLSGVLLGFADLSGAIFEPKNLPKLESIALARNLESMKYRNNPGPLTELRKQFQDHGYREQERAITYALNRHEADPVRLRSPINAAFMWVRRPGKRNDMVVMPLGSFIEVAFKWIAFDLTCRYGLSFGRPLWIVLGLWLLCSGVYAWFMRRPGPSGIYFVASRWRLGKSNTQGVRIRRRTIRATKKWKIPFLWLREEWHLRRAALFFSLMSTFNIGFRDINFGRWLRLLTKREYDLKAVGWARTVSGLQSLLSVYLIALWVLTYFGRPFG